MDLKKIITKNTWYMTIVFIAMSVAANLCMVQVAKSIEEMIGCLEKVQYESLLRLVLRAGVLCVFYIIADFDYWFLYNCVTKKAEKLSVEYAYSHYLMKELDFFSGKGVGDIAYLVTSLSKDVGNYYATFLPMLLVNLVTLLILFGTVAAYNMLFAVFIAAAILLLIVSTTFISKKLAKRTLVSEDLAAEVHNTVVQSFQGISVIKVFRREAYFLKKYREGLSARKYKNDVKRDFWYSMYVVIYDAMVVIFPVAVLLGGFLLRREGLVSVGAVIAIYAIVGRMQEPMREIAEAVTEYKENANRVKKLGRIAEPCFDGEAAQEIGEIDLRTEKIELDGRTLLENVRLLVTPGDVVSLQGASGCGKSTLLKLLIGFTRREGCECRYDGVLQDEIPEVVRYANISLVEQKPFLFSASIKENIMLGEEFGQELLLEVIRVCALEQMAAQYGLEKEIDWASGNISGGEMQRITIARTIIRRPRFLLLDEVTASLDAKTADVVAGNLVAFAKKYGMAVVCVSHKEEFVRFSNQRVCL